VRNVFLRTALEQSYKLEDCLPTISISGEDCLPENCFSTVPSTVPAQSYKFEDCLLTISISGEDCLPENCPSTVL